MSVHSLTYRELPDEELLDLKLPVRNPPDNLMLPPLILAEYRELHHRLDMLWLCLYPGHITASWGRIKAFCGVAPPDIRSPDFYQKFKVFRHRMSKRRERRRK